MEERKLLLVDDEENILRALTRLLRRDDYTIIPASSGPEALKLMAEHSFGVIVTDQRMPGMVGVEFLEQAKVLQPNSVRIMLSGYTELQSVTDAINRGSIFRFLTKPWDDELLRQNIREAFEHYELRAERDRLASELTQANHRLSDAKHGLERRVASQSETLNSQQRLHGLAHEVLEQLPVGVIAWGRQGRIILANGQAHRLLGKPYGALSGADVTLLPEAVRRASYRQGEAGEVVPLLAELAGSKVHLHCVSATLNGEEAAAVVAITPLSSLVDHIHDGEEYHEI